MLDRLELILLLFRFVLRRIEVTFDLNFLSLVERSRNWQSERVSVWQTANRGIEMTPGSETFFSSCFHVSSFPLTAYFDSCWSCINRSISSDWRLRIVVATSFYETNFCPRKKRMEILLPVLDEEISPMVAYSLFPMNWQMSFPILFLERS